MRRAPRSPPPPRRAAPAAAATSPSPSPSPSPLSAPARSPKPHPRAPPDALAASAPASPAQNHARTPKQRGAEAERGCARERVVGWLALALVLQSLALLAYTLPHLAPRTAPDAAPFPSYVPLLDATPLPARSFPFALVTDLDEKSRDPNDFEWHSILKRGILHRHTNGSYTVEFTSEATLTSQTARRNRSMELSELVLWSSAKSHRPLLLAFCDYSGIVYKITPDGKAFRRYAIADGDGNEPNPCKMEWATIKDGMLYIGSMGKEYMLDNGTILHYNAEWVKVIDPRGFIDNYNWEREYAALRRAANATLPGYLLHEAVLWNPYDRHWYFLPRKHSTETPYTVRNDERQGTNLLLIASEDFAHIRIVRVGPLERDWGFSSIKLVPGTRDHFIALKVREIGEETETKMTVFDVHGRLLLEPEWVKVSDLKYEGVEFV